MQKMPEVTQCSIVRNLKTLEKKQSPGPSAGTSLHLQHSTGRAGLGGQDPLPHQPQEQRAN